MQLNTVTDMLKTATSFYDYLQEKITFDELGRPVLNRKHFLEETPKAIFPITFLHSNKLPHKQEILLCFFAGDKRIYPRFAKVFEELDAYRQFLGVVVPDITFTNDMDIELQNAVMTLNQLFAAVLAVNGIKIVGNTRTGSIETIGNLTVFPKNVMWCSGFLGCANSSNFREAGHYVNKVLSVLPSKLLIYGKEDKLIFQQLDTLGIDYARFDDFHTQSKKREV